MTENRTGRRFPVNLPIEFQLDNSNNTQTGETRDFSVSGVYITAAAPFRVGSRVRLHISVPGELVGAPSAVGIECEGRVVRVDKRARRVRQSAPDGVACVIDSYEIIRK